MLWFVTNAAAGSFTVQNGATLTQSAMLSRTPARGDCGSRRDTRDRKLHSTGGSTTLLGGTLGAAPSATVAINGGTMSGPGTIDGSRTNSGALDLGSAPGILSILGNYTQSAGGMLSLRLAARSAGTQFDQLNVTGSAALDGTLEVCLTNGFAPAAAETFAVLNFASSTGRFATFNTPLIPPLGGMPAFAAHDADEPRSACATSAVLLAIVPASITVTPTPATAGQNVQVKFTVQNNGTVAATGPWTDSVYLSTDTTLIADDVLLGRVQHTGSVSGLSSYSGSLSAVHARINRRLVPRLGGGRQSDAGPPE